MFVCVSGSADIDVIRKRNRSRRSVLLHISWSVLGITAAFYRQGVDVTVSKYHEPKVAVSDQKKWSPVWHQCERLLITNLPGWWKRAVVVKRATGLIVTFTCSRATMTSTAGRHQPRLRYPLTQPRLLRPADRR